MLFTCPSSFIRYYENNHWSIVTECFILVITSSWMNDGSRKLSLIVWAPTGWHSKLHACCFRHQLDTIHEAEESPAAADGPPPSLPWLMMMTVIAEQHC